MAQAHEALDTYFDFLKKTVSSCPSGGTQLVEKLKDQATENITAVHELVKKLSQAKDFEEALRIQNEFMHAQLTNEPRRGIYKSSGSASRNTLPSVRFKKTAFWLHQHEEAQQQFFKSVRAA
jgi:hypothetical protein